MKTLKPHLAALALAAAVAGSAAASAQETCGPESASGAPTLTVRSPSGSLHRLVHMPDQGWEWHGEAGSDHPASAPSGAVFASLAPGIGGVIEAGAPLSVLSVFIDGPTGYTYLWVRDEGWKFVGRIADKAP